MVPPLSAPERRQLARRLAGPGASPRAVAAKLRMINDTEDLVEQGFLVCRIGADGERHFRVTEKGRALAAQPDLEDMRPLGRA